MSYFITPPCEQRMEEALLFNMKKIEHANDFKNTLGEIFLDVPQRKDITRWPAVVLSNEATNRYNVSADGKENGNVSAYQTISYITTYNLHVFDRANGRSAEERRNWRASIVSDVTKMLMNNAGLIGEDGCQTAFTVIMGPHKGFEMLDKEPFVGVSIRFFVRWGHDELDPTTFTF